MCLLIFTNLWNIWVIILVLSGFMNVFIVSLVSCVSGMWDTKRISGSGGLFKPRVRTGTALLLIQDQPNSGVHVSMGGGERHVAKGADTVRSRGSHPFCKQPPNCSKITDDRIFKISSRSSSWHSRNKSD